MMQVSGGVQPQAAGGDRWYANVPLSANGPTAFTVSFENGGLQATQQVQWQATDLLQAGNLTIREGDSLLFKMGQNQTPASVSVAGPTNYSVSAGPNAVCGFLVAGSYTVSGTGNAGGTGQKSRGITVTVLKADLGRSPAAWMQKSRVWNCPALPPQAVVESDPRLELISLTNTSASVSNFGMKIDAQEPRYLIARLGAGGPVLGNLRVDGFRLFATTETYVDVVQQFADGSALIECGLVVSPLLQEVAVRLEILVGGVTFDDGTLVKTLTAGDFNEVGQASVRFLRPAGIQTSVCHLIEAYQDGILLGEH
jgi:hypothetical protein